MLNPVALNSAAPVTPMKFSARKAQPQFGISEKQENMGLLALAGLAAAGWGAWKLVQQAKGREKKITSPSPVNITQRHDGSLIINEGRGDFFLKNTEGAESGVLVTNQQGQRIVFTEKTGDNGRLERTVERLV